VIASRADDGACIHAVGSLAGVDGWSVTNVAAFTFSPTGLTAASLFSEKKPFSRAFLAGIVKDHFREMIPATGSSRPTRSSRASETLDVVVRLGAISSASGNLTQGAVHAPLTNCAPEVRPGRFVQYRRHGSQDRDAEYGRSPSSRGDCSYP